MTLPCTPMNLKNSTSHLALLILFIVVPLCASIDTITQSRSLRDGEILVSSGESFALGFFGRGNSSSRYVGIWYKKDPGQSIVWVANRDSPINETSGVMSIDETWNLVIQREVSSSRTVVWSTNLSASTGARYAQLLDSGNLVLFGGDNGGKRTVAWQSFDHPSNTMIPRMKLGFDRRTGLNRFLTSWKSSDDPGTGKYTLAINISGPAQFFVRSGSVRLWRSGPTWGFTPRIKDDSILNTSCVDNETEVSFYAYNASIVTTIVLSESGTLARLKWNEGNRSWDEFWSAMRVLCDRYGHCGPNSKCDPDSGEFECTCLPGYEPRRPLEWQLGDASGGCVRKREHKCGEGDGFVPVVRVMVPDTSTAHLEKGVGLKECGEKCLRNCSCAGYAVEDVRAASGCVTWDGDLVDTKSNNGGQDLFVRVDAIELAQYSNSKVNGGKRRMVAILVVSLVVGSFLIVILAYWLFSKGKKEKHIVTCSNILDYTWRGKQLKEIAKTEDLAFYSLSTIVDATDNFSSANMLGRGGFGSVYKGQLANGQEVAIKKLSKNSGQGIEEFKNEVTLIAKLQHRNLVRLIGCCIKKDEKMLIYEYLPKKGLDSFIFDKVKGSLLDWRKRFDIILGIVRGLLYLHQDSRLRIIHRDLKASNVLLDAAMNPKISDFGLARMFGGDQTEANTRRIVGTYGYMSPEYAMQGLFSIKSDVFSFGVLILEIISSKRNTGFHEQNSMNLIGHVWELWREEKALDIVDSSLGNSYPAYEVLRCIHIALLCVQESAIDRPTMSVVASMLSNEATLSTPKQPAFILRPFAAASHSTTKSDVASSVNEVTVTVVHGR